MKTLTSFLTILLTHFLIVSTTAASECPEWVTSLPEKAGTIFAVAAVPISSAGTGRTLSHAEIEGRKALAAQLAIQTKYLAESIHLVTGVGQGETVDNAIRETVKQYVDKELRGSLRLNWWIDPQSQELWVLMKMPMSSQYRDAMKNAIRPALASAWNNPIAQERINLLNNGIDRLDKADANPQQDLSPARVERKTTKQYVGGPVSNIDTLVDTVMDKPIKVYDTLRGAEHATK